MGHPIYPHRAIDREMICPICYTGDVGKVLRTTANVVASLRLLSDKRQEYFVCLSLDSNRRLLAQRIITIGLLDATLAHPREVFAGAIADRAHSVIVAHNHPSGETSPSEDDIKTTQQLAEAGQLLGIPLRDHVIVTAQGSFSFKQHSLLS